MDAEIRQKLNRVYGRGYFDGLKAATEDGAKELTMNETRFNTVFRGQTDQAKKVYQAVPISEPWTHGQILAELTRTCGMKDYRTIAGCLNSLKDAGLVKELANGTWVRVEVRAKVVTTPAEPEPVEEKPEVQPVVKPAPTKANTPLERIGGLSAQVLAVIQNLHQLAADIEATAIEVEEQIEKIQKDSARLKQLQELLKGLA